MEVNNQQRHEALVDFLSRFQQFQDGHGGSSLKKIPHPLSSDKVEYISVNDINQAVVAFTDVLNIASGSAGNYDLYKLLQAYLTVPESRGKFNTIAREALFGTRDELS
jgi:hypothetical protein